MIQSHAWAGIALLAWGCGTPRPVSSDGGAASVSIGPGPGGCDGGCGLGQDAGCTPQCDGKECGPDGCGGSCGACDAGVCTAAAQCAVDCFPAHLNDNLNPSSAQQGPVASGGVTCSLDGLLALNDGQSAGLAYSGTASVMVGGKPVTACAVADFGHPCLLGPKIGFGYAVKQVGDICGDTGGTQCAVSSQCGSMPGAGVSLFAAQDLGDVRWLMDTGNCGSGSTTNFNGPITALSEASTLKSVRYLLICRPYKNCSASDANISVDALFLTYRN